MIIAALFALLAAAPADRFAQTLAITDEQGPVDPAITARMTATFNRCQDKAQVTSDNDACYAAEFGRQDALLNRTWARVFARVTGRDHARLLAAQRRWLAARDPFCRKVSDGYAGGTIAPVIWSSCRVELTIRRTIWLENLR